MPTLNQCQKFLHFKRWCEQTTLKDALKCSIVLRNVHLHYYLITGAERHDIFSCRAYESLTGLTQGQKIWVSINHRLSHITEAQQTNRALLGKLPANDRLKICYCEVVKSSWSRRGSQMRNIWEDGEQVIAEHPNDRIMPNEDIHCLHMGWKEKKSCSFVFVRCFGFFLAGTGSHKPPQLVTDPLNYHSDW